MSTSRNNDEMITKLVEAGYIKTPQVEKAFRAVDRGNYVFSTETAYSDSASKRGNIHISAPCIYAKVRNVHMMCKS